MGEPSLLSLSQIDTFYGPVQVHFGLNLKVNPGEIVCLLGGNASGKSTTMKVILGLVEPRAGEVLWDGYRWNGVPTPRRIAAGLASVPESRRLFPEMTVGENLLMGAYVRRDRAQVLRDQDELLAQFPRLGERLGQRAGTLSGGEQQMVALGRALMGRPRLICMDEPTMGLSPLWVEKIWDLVVEIQKKGTAFFLVEQNAHLALELAHRGYVLQNGHLVLEGTSRELRDDPRIRDAYLGADQMSGI
ncbi:MAG TPA: ABC transporter ATP-binding protein [Spirochaetia bacterium]|jgi:branched-chain amino acid transport system ATP-binding protein|nr:ABC transporter ATP-binding protein [Spirochaetia bacterium]